MLWTVSVLLLIVWLLGWGFILGGSLIHLVLVLALLILVIDAVRGRRTI